MRGAAARDGVLRVGGVVQQVVHGVAVAGQVHLRSRLLSSEQSSVMARRIPHGREAAGVADRRRVRVPPVAAELEGVVAAQHARQEVAGVERQAVDRTDEHALRRRSGRSGRSRRSASAARRAARARGSPSDEVVADVRVLHVDQQPVADDPLVAELVGRVRAGVPPVLAVRRRHRALRSGRLDRMEVVGAARVALLLGEVVEEATACCP